MIDKYLEITSIDPKYWGKSGWIFLNSIALTYKPEHKEKYKLLIQQLPYILPCISCGQNLQKKIHEIDDALKNKETFIKWLLELRNDIQKEKLRELKTLDHNIYEIFTLETTNNWTTLKIILFIIILIILVYLLKNINNN